ncbi:MAG: permease [Bacteroidales bacterium]|nr:permease [Bacteroidales bacterium]
MEFVIKYFQALVMLTADMAPYLLFGFLVSGILKVAIPPNLLTRYMGKSNLQSVTNASLLGIPLPLCSCGVLPAGISLYKNGASKGASVSFLISTPQTGVDSLLVTYSMLGLPFALLRPVAALFTGILGGVLTNKLEKEKIPDPRPVADEGLPKRKFSLKALLHYAYIEMVGDIAKWLTIGLLIAALITVLVPDNFFNEFALSGITGMLLILVVSIPIYVCATSSVPIAAVLLMKGLSPGAMLVFLMAGPATNAATMTVIGKNLGRTTLTIYLASLIAGSLIFGLLIDYLMPANWFHPLINMVGEHQHNILPSWISYGSALLLAGFITYSFLQKISFKKNTNMDQNTDTTSLPYILLSVEGMTCNHCKATVENGISKLTDVEMAQADIENNTLKVFGKNLDLGQLEKTITGLNYIYKGRIK